MTDTGFTFHRNGDISLGWRDDTYWIRLPTIGETRHIEEFGTELGDAVMGAIPTEELKQTLDEHAAAQASGDTELAADIGAKFNAGLSKSARQLSLAARANSLKWMKFVVELVGSDNWPEDPDDWPATCHQSDLVRQIQAHWAQVPLASSAPSNGAQTPKTLTA